jgi:hypothetical protein
VREWSRFLCACCGGYGGWGGYDGRAEAGECYYGGAEYVSPNLGGGKGLMRGVAMLGTAKMVLDGQHPAIIREQVSTPAGCTIAGLLAMEDGRVRSVIARTIQEATNVAGGLGKKK